MDIYILDSQYRQVDVIDKHESFIWAERFREWGDFELKIQSTNESRTKIKRGVRLFIEESYRVMIVETIHDSIDEEGRRILKATGRSLESILEDRLARDTMADLTTEPKWIWEDPPALIANSIFNHICVSPALDPGDVIPGIGIASEIFPPDTIPFPSDTVIYEIDMMSLYQAIRDLCFIYRMGFRIVRDLTGMLWFDVYMGSDRTTLQTDVPAVVFSPGFDNLANVTELSSDALYKNAAYVISPVGSEIVYSDDVDSSVEGFDRKVLFIKAEDITDPSPSIASDLMIQRGKDELAKHRKLVAFDGVLTRNSGYEYGVDYNLGDLLEYQNETGTRSVMRVTEQIFISDAEGDRSYPTLEIDTVVVTGSYDAWPPDEVIDDVNPDLVIDDA